MKVYVLTRGTHDGDGYLVFDVVEQIFVSLSDIRAFLKENFIYLRNKECIEKIDNISLRNVNDILEDYYRIDEYNVWEEEK